MARNRRTQTGGARLGPFWLVVGLCGFLCISGMGYVWHRNRNEQLSRQLRQRAVYLETVRMQNQNLDRQLEELRSPRALQAAIQRWHLGLVVPQPEQVLRLPELRPEAILTTPSVIRLAATRGAH